ncbi:CHASE2 domain-containing protein [Aestuariivirga sp.]|uniref:CHASE2 domain-containing protein n=1 Tax=Aestuariivirga sp. TaxID=2650926 RepID=UPI00391A9FCF
MAGAGIGRRGRWAGLLAGLGVTLVAVLLRWLDPAPLQDMREATLDIYQQLKPRAAAELPVVTVVIDDRSLREIGQWPWPRLEMAELSRRLFDAGAAAVAFDILFSEPDRFSPELLSRILDGAARDALPELSDGDAAFAQALSGKPSVMAFAAAAGAGALPELKAGLALTGEDVSAKLAAIGAAVLPLPLLEAAASGLGHISINARQLGSRVREIPLFLSGGGQLYPALSLEALRLALGSSTYVVKGDPYHAGAMESVRVGDSVIPVTEAGTFRFYAAPGNAVPSISASEILSGALPAERRAALAGTIVLVGVSAAGLQDIRVTPLGEAVPGVAIHAQVLQQILTGQFLHRPSWAHGVELLAVAALSLLMVALAWFLGPLPGLAAALAIAAMVLAGCWFLFADLALLIDPLAPLAAASLTVFTTTVFWYLASERERRYIREAFERYVSPAVLARIEQSPDALRLGGVNRDITVLFMDVRNFTALSEGLSPQETVRFLNTLHGALSAPVLAREGTLDKYIGDSLMAIWNAPLDVDDHAGRAAEAAMEMSAALALLNENDAFGLGPGHPVKIGIGINSGLACVGNMGTLRRLNYSAVGDTVNTAARIEAASKDLGVEILLSEETARRLSRFRTRFAGIIHLKGKSAPCKLYALEGRPS